MTILGPKHRDENNVNKDVVLTRNGLARKESMRCVPTTMRCVVIVCLVLSDCLLRFIAGFLAVCNDREEQEQNGGQDLEHD
jgi:hypothetical protein